MKRIIPAILTLSLLTSCGATPLVDVKIPKQPGEFASSEERREFRDSTELAVEFETAVDDFAYRTGELLLAKEGNINYSPMSLYLVLAMAAQGANGSTEEALCELLGQPSDTLADQCERLYRKLSDKDSYSELRIANSSWSSVGIKPDFAQIAAEKFYSESFDSLDAAAISDWIAEQTKSTLKPEINVGAEEVLKLINTVYFKSEWSDRFKKSATEPATFHAPSGDVTTDFMNRSTQGSFSRGEGFTRAGLGLKNGSMHFILPDEGVDIRDLIATVGLEELVTGGEGKYGDVIWSVPKFAFSSDLSLKDAVASLGCEEIFAIDADFTDLADANPLYIGGIQQGTHIAIDENGVTASAYTELMYAGAALPDGRADMILDRPFLYTITVKGQILFVGIVDDPTAASK